MALNYIGYHPFAPDDVGPHGAGEYGSFEVFAVTWDTLNGPGFYWAAGYPGCLWDSEPIGPFDTAKEAYDDARNS